VADYVVGILQDNGNDTGPRPANWSQRGIIGRRDGTLAAIYAKTTNDAVAVAYSSDGGATFVDEEIVDDSATWGVASFTNGILSLSESVDGTLYAFVAPSAAAGLNLKTEGGRVYKRTAGVWTFLGSITTHKASPVSSSGDFPQNVWAVWQYGSNSTRLMVVGLDASVDGAATLLGPTMWTSADSGATWTRRAGEYPTASNPGDQVASRFGAVAMVNFQQTRAFFVYYRQNGTTGQLQFSRVEGWNGVPTFTPQTIVAELNQKWHGVCAAWENSDRIIVLAARATTGDGLGPYRFYSVGNLAGVIAVNLEAAPGTLAATDTFWGLWYDTAANLWQTIFVFLSGDQTRRWNRYTSAFAISAADVVNFDVTTLGTASTELGVCAMGTNVFLDFSGADVPQYGLQSGWAPMGTCTNTDSGTRQLFVAGALTGTFGPGVPPDTPASGGSLSLMTDRPEWDVY